ncbi:type IVB secretion system protein IcmH/DotU [Cupriavidus sp. 2MCAB6]|uniref:type IVB secretion system protein IcmH/DotU n=1 Tax=Cupriavidus sp. 2MCAB6 TaxID=3232981 RepID=UPI003F8E735A
MDAQKKPEPATDTPPSASGMAQALSNDGKPAAINSEEPRPKRRVIRPPPTMEQRLKTMLSAPNPLMEAAWPLALAVAEMPPVKDREMVPHLHDIVTAELKDFQELAERANIKHEHIVAAHYCLCSAIDEGVQRHDWGQGWWTTNSLLVLHHQDNRGGERFFQLLARLLKNPTENIDVIEVMYILLSLGFQGRYCKMPDGTQRINAIRRRLYDLLLQHRGPVPKALSPHWKPAPPGRFPPLRVIPVWITVALSSVILLGMFISFKYQLLVKQREVLQILTDIGNMKPPPPPMPLRLTERLKDEIARGVVAVKDDYRRSTVVFRGDDMFGAGQAEVRRKLLPALDKLAAEFNKVEGTVQIIGHSDNQPIKSARYPSNQALSEERATVVSEYLASRASPRSGWKPSARGIASR